MSKTKTTSYINFQFCFLRVTLSFPKLSKIFFFNLVTINTNTTSGINFQFHLWRAIYLIISKKVAILPKQ